MISFYGTIVAGEYDKKNKYPVLFDSGSEDVFLFDETCKDEDC